MKERIEIEICGRMGASHFTESNLLDSLTHVREGVHFALSKLLHYQFNTSKFR